MPLWGESKIAEVIEPDVLKQTAASDEIRLNLLQHRAGMSLQTLVLTRQRRDFKAL